MTQYRFVTHNAGDLERGVAIGMVNEYLKEQSPDFISMPEGDPVLRDVLKRNGYRVRVANPGLGTYILTGVRDDHKIRAANEIATKETWRGPKVPTRRDPRVYPLITWETDDGTLFDTTGIHFPYDGPRGVNGAAWRESATTLSNRWNHRANLPKNRHQVDIGDWNGSKADLRQYLNMRDSHVLDDNLAVDHIVTSTSLELVRGRRLADTPAHPPYLWTVKD